jgi:formylglycine-generating enzyme required for sulfatase activity
MKCPICQHNNSEKAKRCKKCGNPLNAPSQISSLNISSGANTNIGGSVVGRDQITVNDAQGPVIIAKDGSTIVIGERPIEMTAVERESTLGRYLSLVIKQSCRLQLKGIGSRGRLVNIELEHIYITLRTTQTRTVQDDWTEDGRPLRVKEKVRLRGADEERLRTETGSVKVQEALAKKLHLVVLGDPGSGKTMLLHYLALGYARDRAEKKSFVQDSLGLPESGHLPILLPLRRLGAYLLTHHPRDDGVEGHVRLLKFLREYLKGVFNVPDDFFDADLEAGRAVILLDGIDEVGDAELRRRVARLIDAFVSAYPKCRVVVTSRVAGYTGAARLSEDFATTTIRDFTLTDVEQFLTHWNRLVAIGEGGSGESAENDAVSQTQQLLTVISANPCVRELAVNPLMLTVIALVHRERAKLPDRRAELYAEAVKVLLETWDKAKETKDVRVQEIPILEDRPFNTDDRHLLLQKIALKMHEAQKKEIEADDLRRELQASFAGMTSDAPAAGRAVERFLNVIQERTGLLVEAGQGVYRFSHLTFQEYLAAQAILKRDDCVKYTLKRTPETWWREVILLAVGQLSTDNPERMTKLIQRIADLKTGPTRYHNLVLALEALHNAGTPRLDDKTVKEIKVRLQKKLEGERPTWSKLLGDLTVKGWVEERGKVIEALARSGTGYWSLPYGEPEWITVPAGEFWMGEGKEEHRVFVPEFQIARVPVTNAQYQLFMQATGIQPPKHWEDGQPPKGKASHPIVYVSWYNAREYCRWLSKVTGKVIRLPTEAEWEKAARGDKDKRIYPWSGDFDSAKCNSSELGLWGTSPVGAFPAGASPNGVLDVAGNVWEWCQSKYALYPYKPNDGREDLGGNDARVVKGGSCVLNREFCRTACRFRPEPDLIDDLIGFRVACSL